MNWGAFRSPPKPPSAREGLKFSKTPFGLKRVCKKTKKNNGTASIDPADRGRQSLFIPIMAGISRLRAR